MTIPALVKSLRERLGLTQEQFAREVGVAFSTVNQWENGHRHPQPFLLKRLREMEAASGKGSVRALDQRRGPGLQAEVASRQCRRKR